MDGKLTRYERQHVHQMLDRNSRRIARMCNNDRVSSDGEGPLLPHPRLSERAFVVLPLAELAPDWRHPVSGLSALELSLSLAPGHGAEPME